MITATIASFPDSPGTFGCSVIDPDFDDSNMFYLILLSEQLRQGKTIAIHPDVWGAHDLNGDVAHYEWRKNRPYVPRPPRRPLSADQLQKREEQIKIREERLKIKEEQRKKDYEAYLDRMQNFYQSRIPAIRKGSVWASKKRCVCVLPENQVPLYPKEWEKLMDFDLDYCE